MNEYKLIVKERKRAGAFTYDGKGIKVIPAETAEEAFKIAIEMGLEVFDIQKI
jgi:hypothetical protein